MLANDSWPAHVFTEQGLQHTPAWEGSRGTQDGEGDAGKTQPVLATYILQLSKSLCCSPSPKITAIMYSDVKRLWFPKDCEECKGLKS